MFETRRLLLLLLLFLLCRRTHCIEEFPEHVKKATSLETFKVLNLSSNPIFSNNRMTAIIFLNSCRPTAPFPSVNNDLQRYRPTNRLILLLLLLLLLLFIFFLPEVPMIPQVIQKLSGDKI